MPLNQSLATLQRIEKKIDRVNAKLTELMNKPAKQTWITAAGIQALTGWDGSAMRKARDMNFIQYKSNGKNGHSYLLESLNDRFIVNTKLNQ